MARSQAKVMGEFFFFSLLMFTLPFAAYFGTKSLVEDYFKESKLPLDIVLPVISSVITIWTIIGSYVYIAYNDPENFEEEQQQNEKKDS